jgi:hypothetical protein
MSVYEQAWIHKDGAVWIGGPDLGRMSALTGVLLVDIVLQVTVLMAPIIVGFLHEVLLAGQVVVDQELAVAVAVAVVVAVAVAVAVVVAVVRVSQ